MSVPLQLGHGWLGDGSEPAKPGMRCAFSPCSTASGVLTERMIVETLYNRLKIHSFSLV